MYLKCIFFFVIFCNINALSQKSKLTITSQIISAPQPWIKVIGFSNIQKNSKVYLYLYFEGCNWAFSRTRSTKGHFVDKLFLVKPLGPGNWKIMAKIKQPDKNIRANSFFTITKGKEEALLHKKILLNILKNLQKIYKDIKQDKKTKKKKWLQKSQKRLILWKLRIKRIRNRWLAPAYPHSTNSLDQMVQLMQALLILISQKKSFHLQNFAQKFTREQNKVKKEVLFELDIQSLAEDIWQVENLYQDVLADTQRWQKSTARKEFWIPWATNWQNNLVALRNIHKKYQKSPFRKFAEHYPKIYTNLVGLWTSHLQNLKRKYPTLNFKLHKNLQIAKQVIKNSAYQETLDKLLTTTKQPILNLKQKIQKKIEQDYQQLLQWSEQLQTQYKTTKKNKKLTQWKEYVAKFESQLKQQRDKMFFYRVRPNSFFYPKVANLLFSCNSSIANLTKLLDENLRKVRPKNISTDLNTPIYSRTRKLRKARKSLAKTFILVKAAIEK